jgi:hypothetical protein
MTSCNRCGAELEPGSLKYLITVNVTADFDGVLPTQVEMEDLEAFMRQIDRGDPAQMENDVYLSQGYVLCPACKAAFLADPLGTRSTGGGPVPGPGNEDEGGKVH